jgi:asparagine synthase (glutamine-hydrolysing)
LSQGIFGIVDFKCKIKEHEILTSSISSFLKIDGSTDSGLSYIFDRHYILGMKRIPNGQPHQQVHLAQDINRHTFCVMHGEIFNYQNLVDTYTTDGSLRGDLDLFLYLYKKQGPPFATKLNGLFSLAILDMQNAKFIILNDRFGMAHQVYWTTVDNRFYFATHLKTLLAIPDVRRIVDSESLNLFLKYSYIPSPRTIFKNIQKLPPGHMLIFRDGKTEINRYWEFPSSDSSIMDMDEAVTTYRRLLTKSISRRFSAEGNVGILLSGGLDSSANVALALECTEKKLKTFSVGFADPAFDESTYARVTSRHFNTEHFEYTITGREIEDLPKLIWHLEEPYFEFGLFLTYLGLAITQGKVDSVIGGEGADQLFGTGGFAGGLPAALYYVMLKYKMLGPSRLAAKILRGEYFYERDNLAFKVRLLLNRAVDLNNWYFYGYDEHELSLIHKDPKRKAVPNIFLNGKTANLASFPSLYHNTQMNQDLTHYVNENVMVKSGRMADMIDVILRESYLDVDVTDFLVSLDYPLKRSGNLLDHFRGRVQTKFLQRKAMEGLLPPEIMSKSKQGGFVPVMIFLKDWELRNSIYYYLLNSEVIKEYFNIDYLRKMFSQYEDFQGKKIYWHNFYNSKANRILFLLTFDIWHHFYIDNDPLTVSPMPLNEYLKINVKT